MPPPKSAQYCGSFMSRAAHRRTVGDHAQAAADAGAIPSDHRQNVGAGHKHAGRRIPAHQDRGLNSAISGSILARPAICLVTMSALPRCSTLALPTPRLISAWSACQIRRVGELDVEAVDRRRQRRPLQQPADHVVGDAGAEQRLERAAALFGSMPIAFFSGSSPLAITRATSAPSSACAADVEDRSDPP
jgi:hypothetical protein